MELITPELKSCREMSQQRFKQTFILNGLGLLMLAGYQSVFSQPYELLENRWVLLIPILLLLAGLIACFSLMIHRQRLRGYTDIVALIDEIFTCNDITIAHKLLAKAQQLAQRDQLYNSAMRAMCVQLDQHLDTLSRQDALKRLQAEVIDARKKCQRQLGIIKQQIPLIKTEGALRETLDRLNFRRDEINKQWLAAYEKFSWWNKIKYAGEPDFSEMDHTIEQLKKMHNRLLAKHEEDFKCIDVHLSKCLSRAYQRIIISQEQIGNFITDQKILNTSVPLQAGLMLSALSVPLSLWDDFNTAGDIYDALRSGVFQGSCRLSY